MYTMAIFLVGLMCFVVLGTIVTLVSLVPEKRGEESSPLINVYIDGIAMWLGIGLIFDLIWVMLYRIFLPFTYKNYDVPVVIFGYLGSIFVGLVITGFLYPYLSRSGIVALRPLYIRLPCGGVAGLVSFLGMFWASSHYTFLM